MSFTSFAFLLYIGVVLTLYYMIPRRRQWVLLLVASYCFYLYSGLGNLCYILLAAASTYAAARIADRIQSIYDLKAAKQKYVA